MNPSDQQVFLAEGSEVVLWCEVYGYPRDSSLPVWTWSGGELSDRSTTTVTGLLSGASSVSFTERVVSQLTISNATEGDSGEYTCSVPGNSTSINVDIGKFISTLLCFVHTHDIVHTCIVIFSLQSRISSCARLAQLG